MIWAAWGPWASGVGGQFLYPLPCPQNLGFPCLPSVQGLTVQCVSPAQEREPKNETPPRDVGFPGPREAGIHGSQGLSWVGPGSPPPLLG